MSVVAAATRATTSVAARPAALRSSAFATVRQIRYRHLVGLEGRETRV
jgi:hypothetical protein